MIHSMIRRLLINEHSSITPITPLAVFALCPPT
jgi:hypothetical protein